MPQPPLHPDPRGPAPPSPARGLLAWLDRLGWRLAAAPAAVRLGVIAVFAALVLLPGLAALPVMDRDEARFVQASRQMVQSGDPIDIRFQDEPRHKKPVGIYWAQSAAALASGQGAEAPLWVWRLPSAAGAIAASVLVAVVAAPLVGPGAALMAALLMAATLVLGGEARIAKTDAALLALILGAQAALVRLYVAGMGEPLRSGEAPRRRGRPGDPRLNDAGPGSVSLGVSAPSDPMLSDTGPSAPQRHGVPPDAHWPNEAGSGSVSLGVSASPDPALSDTGPSAAQRDGVLPDAPRLNHAGPGNASLGVSAPSDPTLSDTRPSAPQRDGVPPDAPRLNDARPGSLGDDARGSSLSATNSAATRPNAAPHHAAAPSRRPLAWLFWTCLAASILIKGPIGPMVIGLTALAVSVLVWRASWLRPLVHWPAIGGAALMVLPWLIAITVVSGGDFWRASVGDDLLAKTAEGVEGKGAPPGTYLVAMWLTFFPATLILIPALGGLWRGRRDPAVVFLLGWLVPCWLLFEAVPTKLIHYTMPLYPALAILTAALWLGRTRPVGRVVVVGAGVALAVMLAGMAALAFEALRLGAPLAALMPLGIGTAGAALAGGAALVAMRRDLRWSAALLAALAGAALHPALILTLAQARVIWPTERAVEAAAPLAAARGCASPHLTGWGYEEPSLVWRGGRETRLLGGDAALPAEVLADPCAVVVVDRGRLTGPIPPGMTQHALEPAFSLGAGRAVDLVLLQPE